MTKQNKNWRLTKKEFLQKVDQFISKEYPFAIEYYNSIKENGIKKEMSSLKDKINSYNIESCCRTDNTARKLKLEFIQKNTDKFWKDWSLTHHEPDEIIFMTLIDRVFKTNNICFSYICGVDDNLTEDLIEDMMFINSDLFDFEYWDDKHVETVCSILAKGNKYDSAKDLKAILTKAKYNDKFKEKIKRLLEKSQERQYGAGKVLLREQLDWYNIDVHQKDVLSTDFLNKYSELIKKSYISVDEN